MGPFADPSPRVRPKRQEAELCLQENRHLRSVPKLGCVCPIVDAERSPPLIAENSQS